jgi:hypothetical protein
LRLVKRSEPSRLKSIRSHSRKPAVERLEDRTLVTGPNPIANGDFSLGNTGVTTGYTYSPGDIGPAGSYDVVDNPAHSRPHDTNPASFGDHTTGTGLMLAVNGAEDPTRVVWSQTVSVAANSQYDFSLWVASWFASSRATLDIRFKGVSVVTPTAPSSAGAWQQFATTWNSAGATALTVSILDTNPADVGSDFALDDLSLTAAAATVDANADFEAGWAAGTNPNGVWSYGRTTDLGGLFTRHYIPPVNNDLEHGWDDPSDRSGFTPSVARNAGGDYNDGNVTFRAGALILHPCGVSGRDDAHVIFTAPAAGTSAALGALGHAGRRCPRRSCAPSRRPTRPHSGGRWASVRAATNGSRKRSRRGSIPRSTAGSTSASWSNSSRRTRNRFCMTDSSQGPLWPQGGCREGLRLSQDGHSKTNHCHQNAISALHCPGKSPLRRHLTLRMRSLTHPGHSR